MPIATTTPQTQAKPSLDEIFAPAPAPTAAQGGAGPSDTAKQSLDSIFAPTGGTPGSTDKLDSIFKGETPAAPPEKSVFEKMGESATKDTVSGIMDGYKKAKEDLSAGTVAGGIHAVADVGQIAFSPLAAAFNAVTGGALPKMTDAIGKGLADIPAVEHVLNKLNDYFDAHPDQKRLALEDAPMFLNMAAMGVGGGGAREEVMGSPADAIGSAKELGGKVVNTTSKVAGAAGDVITDAAGKAKGALQDRAVNQLEDDYYKWGGATKAGAKNIAKGEARTSALDAAGTEGNAPQRILAEERIVPKTKGTMFDTADQATEFRKSLEPLHRANADALKEVDMAAEPKNVDELRAAAERNIRSVKKPEGEIESMVADSDKEFDLLKKKYGDTMTASEMNLEKQKYSGGVKWDGNKPLQGEVNYNIRQSFQKGVEETATKAGFEDVAQLNREIGDRLNAADYLDKLNGQSLKYGKIGKYAFMTMGAMEGTGITGKIAGALGGNIVANILMKADVAGPVKRLILRSIEDSDPQAYKDALGWIKKQGLDREMRLKLPAGGEGSKPSTIELPGKGALEHDQQIRESQQRIFEGTTPSGVKYRIEPQ